jgi:hypothetical protein
VPKQSWVQSGYCALSLRNICVGYAGSGVSLRLTYVLPSITINCILLVNVKVVVDGSTYVNCNTKFQNGMK